MNNSSRPVTYNYCNTVMKPLLRTAQIFSSKICHIFSELGRLNWLIYLAWSQTSVLAIGKTLCALSPTSPMLHEMQCWLWLVAKLDTITILSTTTPDFISQSQMRKKLIDLCGHAHNAPAYYAAARTAACSHSHAPCPPLCS
ncbi:hypothetical protein CEUSTIGMA_g3595.t1 [Chlamydomonas eustigma]|uniref:Uncharacterized protein n=1 Tax=Chlamydomonas eustigma TaxID=1157962 RepID=A0A250WZ97_9CHLO|nr:hypothetical protein CEUSTIGMA_g3595.t1 [Chlamydomonas eustigma]|eukprot:GAX76151.1 hypothetical protein CEUSTIGMA_g3595.t1 [Chlamydomonas eustigma]